MKTRPALLLALTLIALVLAIACSSGSGSSSSGSKSDAVTIGALLPLTGALASYGETSQAALADALSTINAGSGGKLTLVTLDTKTDPPTALQQLQALNSQGVKLVIGPYASSEVTAVRDYADQNGIVLVSPLSTARSLAVPGDNVYRFTPDDQQEGAAVAALAYADGVRSIIPVSRNDEGNLGLQSAMKASFEALGGKVVTGVLYSASETNFGPTVQNLVGLLQAAQAGGVKAGIYLTAFAEVSSLFDAAADGAPTLTSVPWYGSDSVALSKDLVADAKAAGFADDAGYPNPILGLPEAQKSSWQPVSDRLAQKLGRTPDAFALASYDALMVAYKAMQNAGASASATALGQELVKVASGYTGLTGAATLNPAGDRALGNYDFWAVCKGAAGLGWTRVATFAAAASGGQAAHVQTC